MPPSAASSCGSFFGERLLELRRSSKPRQESLQEKGFAALEIGWKGKGEEKFFCPGNRVESMAAKGGRGGPRRTPKPFTDEGVLLKVLAHHKELVKDLGPYELINRSGAVDPKGLVRNRDLLRDLLRAHPSDDPTVSGARRYPDAGTRDCHDSRA